MSPPVPHADLHLIRYKEEPSFTKAILSTMAFPYQQCRFVDHYGPNIPGEPDLRNRTNGTYGGCARAASLLVKQNATIANLIEETKSSVLSNEGNSKVGGKCHQLNGENLLLDSLAKRNPFAKSQVMNVPDVRVQYKPPNGPCNPCAVSYSVSAKINENEYISVGFKGQSWEAKFPIPPEHSRPCYFGMCVDSYDNFTSDRIALGYASSSVGGCVREMVFEEHCWLTC
jgi:hypothetical protein